MEMERDGEKSVGKRRREIRGGEGLDREYGGKRERQWRGEGETMEGRGGGNGGDRGREDRER